MRSVTRLSIRPALSRAVRASSHNPSSRRFISLAPPSQKSRSWTSSAVRWAVAVGGVYWYTTTNAFDVHAESYATQQQADTQTDSSELTIEEIASARRQRKLAESKTALEIPAGGHDAAETEPPALTPSDDGLGGLEEEAGQQGAFNEETGEINWDCPCLGGMAYGPCGEQFREAFSCFVFSKEDPKGIDCIDRFKNMQDCFREHPDVYGAELSDDIDDDDYEATQNATSPDSASSSTSASKQEPDSTPSTPQPHASKGGVAEQQQPPIDADKELPKPVHDATDANEATTKPRSQEKDE